MAKWWRVQVRSRWQLLIADDLEEFEATCEEARRASNEKRQELFWVCALTDEVHRYIEELYRSREMVSMHERLAAQGKLSPEEASCLAEEKVRRDRNPAHAAYQTGGAGGRRRGVLPGCTQRRLGPGAEHWQKSLPNSAMTPSRLCIRSLTWAIAPSGRRCGEVPHGR